MSNLKSIDSENLLVTRDNQVKSIHYSFYDKHVLNLEDFNGADSVACNEDYCARICKRIKNIEKVLDHIYLYKYVDIDILECWLKKKMLFWDRISDSWEDPYENYFLKEDFVLSDGTHVGADNNIPGVFGQSWTTREETDAMWRIYSQERKGESFDNTKMYYGVRIKTTARKLLDIIYTDDSAMADMWIGKVKYLTEDEINDTLKNGVSNYNDDLGASFFNKRSEFDHECEFRCVKVVDTEMIKKTSGYKRIAFEIADIDDFIDGFVLDPRLSKTNFDVLKNRLLSCGVSPNKISKSILYNFTPIEVRLD